MFNDPTFWQNFEALDDIRAFHDFELHPTVACDLRHMPNELSRVVAVCLDQLEPSKCHSQDLESQFEGVTHQLAGSFDNYANYFLTVRANGDHASNDELHNVMEAIVGVEYGMQTGIWWGTAEWARGEFVKANKGVRLAYAEDRPKGAAAVVYRAPDGKVQGFVRESERQSIAGTYQFVAKDRSVFFDGNDPQRTYTVQTSGDAYYWSASHKNLEKVVNIIWGEAVPPSIFLSRDTAAR